MREKTDVVIFGSIILAPLVLKDHDERGTYELGWYIFAIPYEFEKAVKLSACRFAVEEDLAWDAVWTTKACLF